MYAKRVIAKLIALPTLGSSACAISFALILLAFIFAAPSRPQESQAQTDSVTEAARNSRAQKANSARQPKVITNADLGVEHISPTASTFFLQSSSPDAAEAPVPPAAGCDNPRAERLNMELQAAEQELAQLRSELSYQPPIISGHNLDTEHFQPGSSGLDVGSPPLLDSQPPAPARVTKVELEERIASLQKVLRYVCEPPDAARIQIQVDDLEQQLNLLRRQFDLDQDAYYSKTNFAEDTAGGAQLDAEQQQIQSLQTELEQLRQQLAALNIPQA
jgi:DNA repair exonuclease SbcCD ATPase subunit